MTAAFVLRFSFQEPTLRKLASIRHIADVRPIDGADNIEAVIIDGWQCVVRKGEFKHMDRGWLK